MATLNNQRVLSAAALAAALYNQIYKKSRQTSKLVTFSPRLLAQPEALLKVLRRQRHGSQDINAWSILCPVFFSITHGSLNVPMFHITQPLGIWSIMATFSGDVQYSQNGTFTNPCHCTCAIVSCGNGCSILISSLAAFLTSFKVLPLCDFPFTLHELPVTLAFHGYISWYLMIFGHWCYASACNWGSWPQCLTCHPWCSCWSAHGWESDGHEGHEDWSRSWGRSLWRTPYPGTEMSSALCTGSTTVHSSFLSVSFRCFPLTVPWSDLKHVPHRFLWHVDEKQALSEGLATWIVCQLTHRLAMTCQSTGSFLVAPIPESLSRPWEGAAKRCPGWVSEAIKSGVRTLCDSLPAQFRTPDRADPTWRGGISRHELWGILGNCDLGPWKKHGAFWAVKHRQCQNKHGMTIFKLNIFEEFGRRDGNHAPILSANWAQHLATQ